MSQGEDIHSSISNITLKRISLSGAAMLKSATSHWRWRSPNTSAWSSSTKVHKFHIQLLHKGKLWLSARKVFLGSSYRFFHCEIWVSARKNNHEFRSPEDEQKALIANYHTISISEPFEMDVYTFDDENKTSLITSGNSVVVKIEPSFYK